jgi:hypothetical protein
MAHVVQQVVSSFEGMVIQRSALGCRDLVLDTADRIATSGLETIVHNWIAADFLTELAAKGARKGIYIPGAYAALYEHKDSVERK